MFGSFLNAKQGDHCSKSGCQGTLQEYQGIELGHIFYLGTKYTKAFGVMYKNEQQQQLLMEMGCYGIGVTRCIAAVIEALSDDKGIIWPEQIAPYKAIVIPIPQGKSVEDHQEMDKLACEVYDQLDSQVFPDDVVLEDRNQTPGYKMNDAQFMGFPYAIVLGKSMKQKGQVELQIRKTGQKLFLTPTQLSDFFRQQQ